MGNFRKDIKRGEIGEKIVAQILWATQSDEFKKSVGKFSDWDYVSKTTSIEVKYDEMALKSGNICFETSNGKKLTGIFASKAKEVWYVIPTINKGIYDIFIWPRKKLVDWLLKNQSLVKAVNGGDYNKFDLMLVKREIIEKTIESIGGSKFQWVEQPN